MFFGWLFGAFIAMELFSYALHRWVLHGFLWRIHHTHHRLEHGWFELNDSVSIFFAVLSIILLAVGVTDPWNSPALAVGLGVCLYGGVYFIVHDLYTHRRFLPFETQNAWMRILRRAHHRHHKLMGREGCEPYGLFLFSYKPYFRARAAARRRHEHAESSKTAAVEGAEKSHVCQD